MKIVLGLILLAFSTLIGFLLGGKYSDKLQFYQDFCEFNDRLKLEISFKQTTLLKILENEKRRSDFYLAIKDYIIFKEKKFDKKYIDAHEKEFFLSYLSNIGTSDKNSELKYLENATNIIYAEHNKIKIEEKKYRTLYIKLGFLIGLMLFILVL